MRKIRHLLLLSLLLSTALQAQDDLKIQPDIVYGHKDGLAMTFDVVSPPNPGGAGILFIQSGGWYSGWTEPKALLPACKPFLDRNMTVFIVRHGSAPKYAVPDAVNDVRRCVRYIRRHAAEWGVDPQRLGTLGGSAGGHLSLMLATTGDDGDPAAKDELLRHSSRIAAAVALYPPTDLQGWTTSPPKVIADVPGLKPPLTFPAAQEKAVSPALHVTEDDAPMLLIHGDKDLLVPLEHSHKLMEAAKTGRAVAELVVVEGAGHGYSPDQNMTIVLPAMINWFEKHLARPMPE